MKTLHIHIGVKNIQDSVRFYSTLFKTEPTKLKTDYAQWILNDPKINLSISTRDADQGIDHLGIQVDEQSELENIRTRLSEADLSTYNDGKTVCCYAKSDKSWVTDPSGIAWETFRTTAHSNTFYKDNNDKTEIDNLETLTTNNSGSSCC